MARRTWVGQHQLIHHQVNDIRPQLYSDPEPVDLAIYAKGVCVRMLSVSKPQMVVVLNGDGR
jgi:hypothetical protein